MGKKAEESKTVNLQQNKSSGKKSVSVLNFVLIFVH